MNEKLTDKIVRALPSPSSGNRITYCGEIKGFGCRVTSNGSRAFVLNYRAGKRERRLTIGSYPEWSVARAREQAAHLKRQIDLGDDPLAKRKADFSSPTVEDLFDRYCKEHLPKKAPRSASDDKSMWHNYILPRLRNVKLKDLNFSDVDALHDEISRDKPIRANRVIEVFRKALNLAGRWGWLETNPAIGVRKNVEEPRDRYLSPYELEALAEAMREYGPALSVDAIRMIMLTGARKGETLQATWSEIDLSKGVWIKPSHHTKQRKLHKVPLSEATIELLKNIKARELSAQFVFPSSSGEGPMQDVRRTWKSLVQSATLKLWRLVDGFSNLEDGLSNAGGTKPAIAELHSFATARKLQLPDSLEDVRIHDLRHSYASLLVSSGASLPLIGALLGHTQAQTTQRYAHLWDDPQRAATEVVGSFLFKKEVDRER